jgi:hypothetical protein
MANNSLLKYIKNSTLILTTSLFFLSSISLFAQFSVSASYGFQIPGKQDLKFRQYADNVLLQNIKTTYVKSDITPIYNIGLTYWGENYGYRLSYFEWEHISTAKKFLTDEIPPFNSIKQGRDAIFFSLLFKTRFPFRIKENPNISKNYSFIGLGIGETLTEVEGGRTQWRAAFKLSYSHSVPIAKNLRALIEFKLLITRDIDTLPNQDGWFVDTSGRWSPVRFGPHWDTKYHAIQFGLEWNIFN